MSDTFLSPVIEKLEGLLAEEAELWRGVHQDVKTLQDELETILVLLKDAEATSLRGFQREIKALKDELETIQASLIEDAEADHVDQIRALADRVEVVVHEYSHESRDSSSRTKLGQLIQSLNPRHEIACQIQSIQRSLSRIKGGSSSVARDDEAGQVKPPRGSLFIEELIRNLIEELPTRSVISLVGKGGIGKTTLARKVVDDLPSSLRSCLLYFGIFPDDYFIADERLYRLWIAEGLVEANRDKTLEEVAKEYLSELVERNLVSFDESRPIGEGKYVRIDDSVRDIVQLKADEQCFSQAWDERKSVFEGKSRRVAISGGRKNALKNVENSEVRSLFLSSIDDDQVAKDVMATFFEKFKALEVLDVENSLLDSLPQELGNLTSLKYLSLKNTKVKSLPKSISKLRNLLSLDIRDTLIHDLPNEIIKLKKLRHLLAYSYDNYGSTFTYVVGVRLPEGFGDLENLQTLTLVEIDSISVMKELEKLTKLRWLGVSKLTTETGGALCGAIEKMNSLERLYISAIDESEVLDLQHISSPPLSLRELLLIGQLEKLPHWMLQLRNLSGLCLLSSRLSVDPAKSLKIFPNLETLQLSSEAYEGDRLHFEKHGFWKLKKLSIYALEKLKAVKIDREALPVLEELDIAGCWLLQEVFSIQHLRSIKTASLNGRRLV